ncbi:MAG: carbohydrate-binding family 9-like protein [Terriglobia bacterium]
MSRYTSKLSIESRYSKKDFAPDGDLNKPVWKKARWVRFDHDWADKRRYPQSDTQVATCWTPEQIYLAYQCKYSSLNIYPHADARKDKWGLWERDVVEAFLNPDPARVNHYYEFEVAPNNLWIDLEIDLDRKPFNDASWNSGYAHATRIGKSVWTCEIRIPVASMTGRGVEIRAGAEWRGNFFRMDGEGDRRAMAWSPTLTPKMNFHVPTRFGLIRFVK